MRLTAGHITPSDLAAIKTSKEQTSFALSMAQLSVGGLVVKFQAVC